MTFAHVRFLTQSGHRVFLFAPSRRCGNPSRRSRQPSKAMETAMTRFTLLLFVVLLCGAYRSTAQEKVEARGITSEIKLDEVTFGHLTELNGKFRMRATEFTFAPGAYLGVHHHVGPGIRYILSGELTFTEGG